MTNKIKSIMALKDITPEQYAAALNINKQSVFNKFSRDSFTIHDLSVLAEMVGGSLSVVFPDNSTIQITSSD